VETIRLGIRVEDLAASKEKQTSSGMTKFGWKRGSDFQIFLDFKLSPCVKWNMISFGCFPGISVLGISVLLALRRRGNTQKKSYFIFKYFLILSFRHVLDEIWFLLGVSPASQCSASQCY
jgi:hypothetical protein